MILDLLITVTFCAENLFEDGLHLSNNGNVILALNIIYVLNRLILWNEELYSGTIKNNFLLRVNFHNDNYESSNILNSSEVKESCPSICIDVVGNPNLRALFKKS